MVSDVIMFQWYYKLTSILCKLYVPHGHDLFKSSFFLQLFITKEKSIAKRLNTYCRTAQTLYSTHISCLLWGEVPELCTHQRPQCRTRYNQLVPVGLAVSNTSPSTTTEQNEVGVASDLYLSILQSTSKSCACYPLEQ